VSRPGSSVKRERRPGSRRLRLTPAESGFSHCGFEMASPEEARELRTRIVQDGLELMEEEDSETYGNK
jgi:hypothetical protein